MTNIENLEKTMKNHVAMSFEEYRQMREPAVNVIVNDYAAKLIDADPSLTLETAREIAKKEIPCTFVPEWMKNLRISANIAGTELCYLEAIVGALGRIEEILSIAFGEKIEEHLTELSESFRREEVNDGTE